MALILLSAATLSGRSPAAPYLLHGRCDTSMSQTRSTDLEQLGQRPEPLVAMPDGRSVLDWVRGG